MRSFIWVFVLSAFLVLVVDTSMADSPGFFDKPAASTSGAANASLLAAARAGRRIVAVGDHGIVVLSDDDGATFRQAKSVPTRATLNDVRFLNEHEGWIAGHWGVILHTTDGGETWAMQRLDSSVDRPVFTVWFKDSTNGFAAGLWSLMLTTQNSGKDWQSVNLPIPPGANKADKNLYRFLSNGKGLVLIAAEQGMVYRSTDSGQTWAPVATGNKGTFWCGVILDDGTVLLGGLAGKIFRSADSGQTWTSVDSRSESSITDIMQLPDGSVFGVGLDGVSVTSSDHGQSFVSKQREDRVSFTALVANSSGKPIAFSTHGVISLN